MPPFKVTTPNGHSLCMRGMLYLGCEQKGESVPVLRFRRRTYLAILVAHAEVPQLLHLTLHVALHSPVSVRLLALITCLLPRFERYQLRYICLSTDILCTGIVECLDGVALACQFRARVVARVAQRLGDHTSSSASHYFVHGRAHTPPLCARRLRGREQPKTAAG